jgi:hypothetical protein
MRRASIHGFSLSQAVKNQALRPAIARQSCAYTIINTRSPSAKQRPKPKRNQAPQQQADQRDVTVCRSRRQNMLVSSVKLRLCNQVLLTTMGL